MRENTVMVKQQKYQHLLIEGYTDFINWNVITNIYSKTKSEVKHCICLYAF